MKKRNSFEELAGWKSAKELTSMTYEICHNLKLKTECADKGQLQREALHPITDKRRSQKKF